MRLDKVVVGVDFSSPSLGALRWVASDVAPGAELVLVNAVDVPATPPFLRGHTAGAEAVEREACARAVGRLHDLELLMSLPAARGVVRIGRAHEVLRDVARREHADLIAIGPHGERSRQSRLLGTTADRLVRTAPAPVLVAIAAPSAAPSEIIAAVDDSDMATRVLAVADGLARRFGAGLTLLHVLGNAVLSTALSVAAARGGTDEDALDQVRAELRAETEGWLRQLAPRRPGAAEVGAVVAHGNAAEEILAAARRSHAQLIVLGRHGTGRVLPPLLGRTVRTVLHESACSVLVVTPETAGGD